MLALRRERHGGGGDEVTLRSRVDGRGLERLVVAGSEARGVLGRSLCVEIHGAQTGGGLSPANGRASCYRMFVQARRVDVSKMRRSTAMRVGAQRMDMVVVAGQYRVFRYETRRAKAGRRQDALTARATDERCGVAGTRAEASKASQPTKRKFTTPSMCHLETHTLPEHVIAQHNISTNKAAKSWPTARDAKRRVRNIQALLLATMSKPMETPDIP